MSKLLNARSEALTHAKSVVYKRVSIRSRLKIAWIRADLLNQDFCHRLLALREGTSRSLLLSTPDSLGVYTPDHRP